MERTGGELIGNEVVAQNSAVPAIEQTFLTDKFAKLLCDRYEDSKTMIQEGESWTEAITDFVPFIDAYARDDEHEDLARGLLARLFERSYRVNFENNKPIDEFTMGVLQVLSQLRHVPDSLMRPRNSADASKRQPSFFESMMATIKRYKFMEELPKSFDGIADGIIVGGSMGYGPFFSVRDGGGQGDPSDVDAIFVLSEDYAKESRWKSLLASEDISKFGAVSLLSRLATFSAMEKAEEVDVISQRFDVIDHNFNMSAHFMLPEVFERMNGDNLRGDIYSGSNILHAVRDYKPKKFEHKVCAQRSFDGAVYEYKVPEQAEVKDGYIAELPGYIVDGGKFYLGLYQNLISPEFEVSHDNNGVTTDVVNNFRQIVLDYIDKERKQGRIANVALSHIRSSLFAPGRYDNRANLKLVKTPQSSQ